MKTDKEFQATLRSSDVSQSIGQADIAEALLALKALESGTEIFIAHFIGLFLQASRSRLAFGAVMLN
jgi:hypothetical protein